MRGIASVEEAEHPNRTGEHVRSALAVSSKLRLQAILAKRRERLLDHTDSLIDTYALALPNRAQRRHSPGGVLQLGLCCWPHAGGSRGRADGAHLGRV